jgi:hypothetical protein
MRSRYLPDSFIGGIHLSTLALLIVVYLHTMKHLSGEVALQRAE